MIRDGKHKIRVQCKLCNNAAIEGCIELKNNKWLSCFNTYFFFNNFSQVGIRIKDKGCLLPRQVLTDQLVRDGGKGITNEGLCIEDPLTPGNNIGRRSFGTSNVQKSFDFAFMTLEQAVHPSFLGIIEPNHSILGRIIRISDEVRLVFVTLKPISQQLIFVHRFLFKSIINNKSLLLFTPISWKLNYLKMINVMNICKRGGFLKLRFRWWSTVLGFGKISHILYRAHRCGETTHLDIITADIITTAIILTITIITTGSKEAMSSLRFSYIQYTELHKILIIIFVLFKYIRLINILYTCT